MTVELALVIIGASGHGREVAAAARDTSPHDAAFRDIAGFVDDDPGLEGRKVGELRALGALEYCSRHRTRGLLGVGYPETKLKVLTRLEPHIADWPALVHKRASIGERVSIGRGSFVQAGCVLTCDIDVSEFVTVNAGATINHDVTVGRLATISPGAHVGGNVMIGEGAFIGIGASVVQGIAIGAWSVVGAGAVVIEDVAPNAVVAGVPARVKSNRASGWQLD